MAKTTGDRIVRALVVLALPAIVCLALLSAYGTSATAVMLWDWAQDLPQWDGSIPNPMAILFFIAFLAMGPAGLAALVQLVVVLRVRLYEGREGLQDRRRTMVIGLALGIGPLAFVLLSALNFILRSRLDPGSFTFWFLLGGWPLVPLLAYLITETWNLGSSGPRRDVMRNERDAGPIPPGSP